MRYAERGVTSSPGMDGPFEFERALTTRPFTGGKSSVASHYRSPHSNQRLSFLRRKTYLNMSEVNHNILKCKHSCDWLLLTKQMSENSPWEP